MKKLLFTLIACSTISLLSAATAPAQGKSLRIGVVNFKQCVENSKLGKHEQANFENLKKQMESVLGEKEKTMNDMANKMNDPDYLDSISPEAETELKRKFRAMSQEIGQQQQEYMQVLQQTNMKVVQKLNELVTKASSKIAKDDNFDIILNEEASFSYLPDLDISPRVIAILDADFDKEQQASPAAPK